MDLGFKGKTVIITGGTKGIGAGISEVFAQEGANLVINYRSDNEGSSTQFIEGLKEALRTPRIRYSTPPRRSSADLTSSSTTPPDSPTQRCAGRSL